MQTRRSSRRASKEPATHDSEEKSSQESAVVEEISVPVVAPTPQKRRGRPRKNAEAEQTEETASDHSTTPPSQQSTTPATRRRRSTAAEISNSQDDKPVPQTPSSVRRSSRRSIAEKERDVGEISEPDIASPSGKTVRGRRKTSIASKEGVVEETQSVIEPKALSTPSRTRSQRRSIGGTTIADSEEESTPSLRRSSRQRRPSSKYSSEDEEASEASEAEDRSTNGAAPSKTAGKRNSRKSLRSSQVAALAPIPETEEPELEEVQTQISTQTSSSKASSKEKGQEVDERDDAEGGEKDKVESTQQVVEANAGSSSESGAEGDVSAYSSEDVRKLPLNNIASPSQALAATRGSYLATASSSSAPLPSAPVAAGSSEDPTDQTDNSEEEEEEAAVEEEELKLAEASDDGESEEEESEEEEEEDDDDDLMQLVNQAASSIVKPSGSLYSATQGVNANKAVTTSAPSISLLPVATITNRISGALDSGAKKSTYLNLSLHPKKQQKKTGPPAKLTRQTVEATVSSAASQATLYHSVKEEEKAKARDEGAGAKWFNMVTPEMTKDIKRDLEIIKMRNFIDPKRFYKAADYKKKELPKHFQIGTVIEGAGEYTYNRLTNKERQQTIVDELLHDKSLKRYAKRKFLEVQREKQSGGKRFAKQKKNASKPTWARK